MTSRQSGNLSARNLRKVSKDISAVTYITCYPNKKHFGESHVSMFLMTWPALRSICFLCFFANRSKQGWRENIRTCIIAVTPYSKMSLYDMSMCMGNVFPQHITLLTFQSGTLLNMSDLCVEDTRKGMYVAVCCRFETMLCCVVINKRGAIK